MPDTVARLSNTYFVHRLLRARDFQGRGEFDTVTTWWRDRRNGVCALVGIGGAGKTAILERFLRVLPGGLEPDPEVPKDESLAVPGAIMVFSFYDASNPQVFFAQLFAWLKGTEYDPSAPRPSYEQTRAALNGFRRSTGTVLLCLDGLEKVQDDGMRGGIFGNIQDGALDDFILQLAEGYFPAVCAIITTRFPIATLEEERPANYRPIPVDELTAEAAAQLLRQRGVKGGPAVRLRLAENCGRHALTVDLVGGYLAQYHNGDPNAPLNMPSEKEIAEGVAHERNPRRREFMRQSMRFSRVADRYREALETGDTAALALLERICLFRLPVTLDQLAKIFLGPDRGSISGAALAELTPIQLKDKLDGLSAMRLIESSHDGAFSIHPAVRDGFLKDFSASMAREGHAAARGFLEAQLGTSPGSADIYPPAQLDLLEEIVYHTLESGSTSEAYHMFADRMNGVRLALLGNSQRVERLCRVLVGTDDPSIALVQEAANPQDSALVFFAWGLALNGLGRLSNSVIAYRRLVDMTESEEEKAWVLFYCADVAVLQGRLAEATSLYEPATDTDDEWWVKFSRAFRAYVGILRGGLPALLGEYDAFLKDLFDKESESWLFALARGDWIVRSMARFGRSGQARELCHKALDSTTKEIGVSAYQSDRKLYLALAELAIAEGDLTAARDYQQQAMEWARARDHQEMLCGGTLIGAKIALEAAGKDKAQHTRIAEAIAGLEEGLRIARRCGYGILHIDLLNSRALAWLMQGKPGEAERDVRVALFDGVAGRPEGSQPELLPAMSEQCGYAWGEAEGRLRLGEALLLRAAAAQPPDRADLVRQGREQLTLCLELQKRMEDPLVTATEKMLERIDSGWITDYPLPQPEPKATKESWKPVKAPVDFVIVTPLTDERDAVLRKLKSARKLPPSDEDVRVYYAAELPAKYSDGSPTEYKVIVVPLAGMGEKEAANATGDAIRRWKPNYVVLAGIAGGLAKAGVQLGDVLVADQVADYELQKRTVEETIVRWEVHPVNKQLLLAAQNIREEDWLHRIDIARPGGGKPLFRFGVICTGNVVMADGLLQQYHKTWDWLIGVEMEAGGAASSAFSQVSPPGFFMVRSASDLADAKKDATDTKKWREYACDVAASFAIGLLESGPVRSIASRRQA